MDIIYITDKKEKTDDVRTVDQYEKNNLNELISTSF